jgi:hypothetical protein
MKATLSFTLPEEQEEFDVACRASGAFAALADVREHIFRPARKHGYSDMEINALMDKLGADATNLIHHLECRFNAILFDRGIDL